MARGVALAAAFVLTGVACGGSGRSGSPSTTTASATAAASSDTCPESAALPTPVSDHGAVAARGSSVPIQAGDFFFAPTCVTDVSAGTLTLTVRNTGTALHNVTIQSLGIDEDVRAGQTITVTVNMGSAPLPFFCKYHRTSGMVGALLPAGG
ncbi:MAG TPA: cupredoxin domain-containing protein [Actinomycetota bacterium]